LSQQSLFVAEADGLEPTEWAVGPWSADTLQASAYGALLVRALERSDQAPGMLLSRLSFDLWRPVTRQHLTAGTSILRDGRKARTLEASLSQAGKSVARCTAVFLKADAASTPVPPVMAPPVLGPDDGRPLPAHVRAWSPFFTGVDTRVVEGDLLKPGPAAAWFNLGRPLVLGEETSPFAHAVAAADLASGISAVVDLRTWTFINADLTVLFWRAPRAPWILLRAETVHLHKFVGCPQIHHEVEPLLNAHRSHTEKHGHIHDAEPADFQMIAAQFL
jgi:acyl-coenzyme A thioesterase PaaI-like protein